MKPLSANMFRALEKMELNQSYTARDLGAHSRTMTALENRGLVTCVNYQVPGIFSGYRERKYVKCEDPMESE